MKISYKEYECIVNEKKKYNIPFNITKINFKGYYLYISQDTGNWIVLENEQQCQIFDMLYQHCSIEEVISRLKANGKDVYYVIAQLEGKHFEMCNDTPLSSGFNLRLYLTNKCNLRCQHCFMYAGSQIENELTTEEWMILINNCVKQGIKKIILTGGEVSLSKSFIPVLECAKEHNLYTQVLTNGVCWSEELFKMEAPLIDEVQISIDGFDEKSNSQIRGENAFAPALNMVDKFVRYGTTTSITVTPLYGYLKKYYKEYIIFARDLLNKYSSKDFLVVFNSEILDGRNVHSSRDENNENNSLVKMIYEELYPNYELTAFVRNHMYNHISRNCGYGGLTVASNGDVYFCGRIFEVKKYGNIRNDSFDSIIEKRKLARIQSSVDNLFPCKKCEIKYICGGGCRISNFKKVTQLETFQKEECIIHKGCTQLYKENIYRLMIEGNDFLLW